jgi:hypothetical protein
MYKNLRTKYMFWVKVGSRQKSVTYFFLYLYITINQLKRL